MSKIEEKEDPLLYLTVPYCTPTVPSENGDREEEGGGREEEEGGGRRCREEGWSIRKTVRGGGGIWREEEAEWG